MQCRRQSPALEDEPGPPRAHLEPTLLPACQWSVPHRIRRGAHDSGSMLRRQTRLNDVPAHCLHQLGRIIWGDQKTRFAMFHQPDVAPDASGNLGCSRRNGFQQGDRLVLRPNGREYRNVGAAQQIQQFGPRTTCQQISHYRLACPNAKQLRPRAADDPRRRSSAANAPEFLFPPQLFDRLKKHQNPFVFP